MSGSAELTRLDLVREIAVAVAKDRWTNAADSPLAESAEQLVLHSSLQGFLQSRQYINQHAT